MAERALSHEAEVAAREPDPVVAPTTDGPGVKALRELFANGEPKPSRVVAILDKHRNEREQIFAFLNQHAGNGYVARVQAELEDLRLSVDRREVVAGDPSSPTDGFFVAGAERRGAAWRTDSGSFSGEIDQSRTHMRYQHDGDTAVRADIDHRARSGVVALEEDGRTVGQLDGQYRSGSDWRVGASRPFDLGEGRTLTPGVRHQERPFHGGSDVAAATYTSPTTTADAFAGRHSSGGFTAGASGTHRFGESTSMTGAVETSPVGTTASLSGSHAFNPRTSMSGSITHDPTATTAALSGSYRPDDRTTYTGGASHSMMADGTHRSMLTASESYRGDTLRHSATITGEHGPDGTRAYGSGQLDAQLRPGLYAGAFGSFDTAPGARDTLGASITLTPQERTALTLAGVIDGHGGFEARLQLDVFKSRIAGLSTISDKKKDALVSLFVAYTQGSAPGMMDDRYGRGQIGAERPAGDGTVSAGIRIRF